MSDTQHRFPASILPAWLFSASRGAGRGGSDVYLEKVKRPLDVSLVLCFAVVFLPFLLLIALALIRQGPATCIESFTCLRWFRLV